MTSDWKEDEKLEAPLRSLVATNLKHKEKFALVCRDFLNYKWSLWIYDREFWYIETFLLTKDTLIDPVFEAVYAEVNGPGKLQEYGALNVEKKIDPERLEKGAIDVKN